MLFTLGVVHSRGPFARLNHVDKVTSQNANDVSADPVLRMSVGARYVVPNSVWGMCQDTHMMIGVLYGSVKVDGFVSL